MSYAFSPRNRFHEPVSFLLRGKITILSCGKVRGWPRVFSHTVCVPAGKTSCGSGTVCAMVRCNPVRFPMEAMRKCGGNAARDIHGRRGWLPAKSAGARIARGTCPSREKPIWLLCGRMSQPTGTRRTMERSHRSRCPCTATVPSGGAARWDTVGKRRSPP